jgi:hypothetical protein
MAEYSMWMLNPTRPVAGRFLSLSAAYAQSDGWKATVATRTKEAGWAKLA